MSWPLSHDYNEAIQNPKLVFSDPELKAGDTVVGARGLPLPRSGNFADVYQVRGSDGSSWAVKCFTRPVVGLDERYARVSAALAEAKLPFVIGFTFLGEGIRVGGAWRPVVKMEWVEGLLLNQVVRENAARPSTLASLGQMWVRLCKRLREARIAHADIQHGNVLLVPGSRPGAYGLKLIDYDGMHVPALANQPSGEVGHPAYQHPARAATRAYSPDLDRFPHLVVLTALKALETGGSALWDRYDTGDNLLFTEEDFRKPDGSKLMRELWLMDNPSVQALVGQLAISCGKPIPRTPWIDEIAPEGEVKLLDPATRHAAAEAIGVPLPVPAALPPEPAHGAPASAVIPLSLDDSAVAFGKEDRHAEVNVELVAEDKTAPRPREYRKTAEKEKSRTHIPLIAGGLLLLGGVATVAILMSRGKKDSVDTVQTPNDVDTKPRQVIDPKGKGQVAPIGPNGTEPKGKEPIEKKSDPPKQQPLELKPVGNLAAKQRWTTELGNDQPISRLASSLDSATIVFRGIKSGSFCLDAAAGQKVPDSSNTFFTPIRSAIPLNDGKFAAPQPFGDTPTPIWDSKARKSIEPLKPFERLSRVRGNSFVSRDIRYLAFGVMGAQNTPAPFMLADLGTGKTVLDFDCVWGQALFPADSRRVLVTERSGNCRWFKLPSGEPDGEWSYRPRATGSAGPIAISADGNVLLHEGQLVDHDAMYHVLDARTGAVLHSFPGLFRVPFGNPLSDDGRMVALVRRDRNGSTAIEIIENATGNPVAQIPAPAGKEFLNLELLHDGSAGFGILAPIANPQQDRPLSLVRYDLVPGGAMPGSGSVDPGKPSEWVADA
ncbi:MAG TPA: hypothetical protein VLM40_00345, partial [Gemmata sp.]|nr:hypothetical protein [Gemmata sp.]